MAVCVNKLVKHASRIRPLDYASFKNASIISVRGLIRVNSAFSRGLTGCKLHLSCEGVKMIESEICSEFKEDSSCFYSYIKK